MDGNIDDVVAGYIVFADIPVEGECQIGNGPVHFAGRYRVGVKCTRDGFRGQGSNMNAMISDDVGFIV